jgi:hypothetical protein
MSSPLPAPVKFIKNKNFMLEGANIAAGLEFVAVKDPAILDALVNNKPFPKEAQLADIRVRGEAGNDVVFDVNKGPLTKGNVTFKASAELFAGLGVYRSTEKLLADLALDDNISGGVDLHGGLNDYFLALRWGYDLAASAKGAIALGAAGSFTFSGEAKKDAAYAVVRRLSTDTKALDAVKMTVNSWLMPTQIESIDDLAPGTWLIAGVSGSVAAQIGIQYGFDFNWVKESAKLGGLSGPIGLRLQLGISAALGFNASGKYAVVIGRDSAEDERVRLRIFKQRQKGWDFALSASADVQMDPSDLIPDNLDDFIKAIFGVHGEQIVKKLQEVDKWTNTEESLPDVLAKVSLKYAQDFLTEVTGIDAIAKFEEARNKLVGFLEQWNNLPHHLATMLSKIVDDAKDQTGLKAELDKIAALADQISAGNLAGVKSLLEKPLEDVNFFKSPLGKWLESIATGGVLNALSGDDALAELKKGADLTKKILAGGDVEGLLKRLRDFINKNLKLDTTKFEAVLNSKKLTELDEWLRARLSAFLGKELDLAALEDIRAAIENFRKKSAKYYDAAVKALKKKYNFSFSYAYQQTATSTALLDVTFDFSKPALLPLFGDAVDGNFNKLLLNAPEGVTLKEASLTHQTVRHSHLEVHLPFFESITDHVNDSLGKAEFVPDGGGLMFSLEATDVVAVKNKLNSRLAVSGSLTLGNTGAVTVFPKADERAATMSYTYSYRQVKKDMSQADLKYQLDAYLQSEYFKDAASFGNGNGAASSWLTDLDNTISLLTGNAHEQFGNTLLSLEVSLPAAVMSAWATVPVEENDPLYMDMSRRLQEKIKFLVPATYFQNPAKYKDNKLAPPILVYAALPATTRITGGDGLPVVFDTNTGVFWEYKSIPNYLGVMLDRNDTSARLGVILQNVVNRLQNTAGLSSQVKEYNETGKLMNNVRSPSTFGMSTVTRLLDFEAAVVNGAHDAARSIAEFRNMLEENPTQSMDKLNKAIKKMEDFGSKVTSTFNSTVSLVGGNASRPLSTLLFLEASRALNPILANVKPLAMLEVIVLKKDAKFDPATYLDGELPEPDETVLQQRIVNLQ